MLRLENLNLLQQPRICRRSDSGTTPTMLYQSFFLRLHRQLADHRLETLVLTLKSALLLSLSSASQKPCLRFAETGRATNNTAIVRFDIHCKSRKPICLLCPASQSEVSAQKSIVFFSLISVLIFDRILSI